MGWGTSFLFNLRFINVKNEWISGWDGRERISGISNDQARPLFWGKFEIHFSSPLYVWVYVCGSLCLSISRLPLCASSLSCLGLQGFPLTSATPSISSSTKTKVTWFLYHHPLSFFVVTSTIIPWFFDVYKDNDRTGGTKPRKPHSRVIESPLERKSERISKSNVDLAEDSWPMGEEESNARKKSMKHTQKRMLLVRRLIQRMHLHPNRTLIEE